MFSHPQDKWFLRSSPKRGSFHSSSLSWCRWVQSRHDSASRARREALMKAVALYPRLFHRATPPAGYFLVPPPHPTPSPLPPWTQLLPANSEIRKEANWSKKRLDLLIITREAKVRPTEICKNKPSRKMKWEAECPTKEVFPPPWSSWRARRLSGYKWPAVNSLITWGLLLLDWVEVYIPIQFGCDQ